MKYRTISAPAEGIYKEKGSKFLAWIHPIASRQEAESVLEKIKAEHPKARHHCYAWRLGSDGRDHRANDDGEPSGSAGLPIYNQLLSAGLTNVMAVVVRYFGGTKLGIPGLIQAYKSSTEDAISNARIVWKEPMSYYRLELPWDLMPHFMEAMKMVEGSIVHQDFAEVARIEIALPRDRADELLLKIYARTWETLPGIIDTGKASRDLALQMLRTDP